MRTNGVAERTRGRRVQAQASSCFFLGQCTAKASGGMPRTEALGVSSSSLLMAGGGVRVKTS
jgi:hypothetical protein